MLHVKKNVYKKVHTKNLHWTVSWFCHLHYVMSFVIKFKHSVRTCIRAFHSTQCDDMQMSRRETPKLWRMSCCANKAAIVPEYKMKVFFKLQVNFHLKSRKKNISSTNDKISLFPMTNFIRCQKKKWKKSKVIRQRK